MTEIVVYDFLCGQGKSTEIMNVMLNNPNEKYCYIAPYLTECHRFAGTVFDEKDSRKKPLFVDGSKIMYQYDEKDKLIEKKKQLNFRHPNTRNKDGSKATSLCSLLSSGYNVVSTHALFTELGSNALDCANEYTLVIDETVNIYEIDSSLADVKYCLKEDIMYLDEDGITLRFNRKNLGTSAKESGEDSAVGSRYEDLAFQCDLGQLLYIDGKLVIWELSIDLLKAFKNVVILTYMFRGSEMYNYFEKKGVKYTYGKLSRDNVLRSVDVAHLIEVVDDDKLNLVGEYEQSLCASSVKGKNGGKYLNKEATKKALKNNLHNLFNQRWKCGANDRMWTSFDDTRTFIANGKYGKQFLAFNYKATNDWMGVHHLAFLLNVYMNPMIKRALNSKGLEIDKSVDEQYAISTLIQWIFRSAVRVHEPIKLYLPSSRMRNLLERWKQGEFDNEVLENE